MQLTRAWTDEVRAPFVHGRRNAAAAANASQLRIRMMPPPGAAIANRRWPTKARSERSPANKAAPSTKPKAAAMPSGGYSSALRSASTAAIAAQA